MWNTCYRRKVFILSSSIFGKRIVWIYFSAICIISFVIFLILSMELLPAFVQEENRRMNGVKIEKMVGENVILMETNKYQKDWRRASKDIHEEDPIDAVYTWVNGSDETLIRQLMAMRSDEKSKEGITLTDSIKLWSYEERCLRKVRRDGSEKSFSTFMVDVPILLVLDSDAFQASNVSSYFTPFFQFSSLSTGEFPLPLRSSLEKAEEVGGRGERKNPQESSSFLDTLKAPDKLEDDDDNDGRFSMTSPSLVYYTRGIDQFRKKVEAEFRGPGIYPIFLRLKCMSLSSSSSPSSSKRERKNEGEDEEKVGHSGSRLGVRKGGIHVSEDDLVKKIPSLSLIYLRGSKQEGSFLSSSKMKQTIKESMKEGGGGTEESIKNVIILEEGNSGNSGLLILSSWVVSGSDVSRLRAQLLTYMEGNHTSSSAPRLDFQILAGNDLEVLVGDDILLNMMSDPVLEEMSLRRFMDNQELKYSLRSLERFVPWIRNVFIVTNGQIPSWLDTSNPRVQVITHEEIFPDPSHLPTFSSAAIECHLHRIPGLSRRFLYINDDVVFGKHVYRENFVTPEHGYKVYLTWPVPDCSVGCPSNWLSDGFCDKPCNSTECNFDGGDCLYKHKTTTEDTKHVKEEKANCSPGCPDSWLGDKFCDVSCNNPECAFDLANCGVKSFPSTFDEIESNTLSIWHLKTDPSRGRWRTTQVLKLNESLSSRESSVLYLNLSSLLESQDVKSGSYAENEFVRSIGVNVRFGVLTVLFQGNFSQTQVWMKLELEPSDSKSPGSGVNIEKRKEEKESKETKRETYKQLIFLQVNRKERERDGKKSEKDGDKSNTSKTSVSEERDKGNHNFSLDFSQDDEHEIQEEETDSTKTPSESTTKDLLGGGFTSPKGRQGQDSIYKIEFPTASLTLSPQDPSYISLPSKNDEPQVIPLKSLSLATFDEGDRIDAQIRQKLNMAENLRQENQLSVSQSSSWRDNNERTHSIGGKIGPRRKVVATSPDLEFSHHVYYRPFKWERDLRIPSKSPLNYKTPKSSFPSRHLLDAFGDSLRHVNRLYNQAFGPKARRVPAHMSHLIDVDIVTRLQRKFPIDFQETSRGKIRRPTDMQYAFSYFYYLMSETNRPNISTILQDFDVDNSGSLSGNELRTLMVNIVEGPVTRVSVESFLFNISNCSSYPISPIITDPTTLSFEVTSSVILMDLISCSELVTELEAKFGDQSANKFEIVGSEDVSFVMIHSNATLVMRELDELRRRPKKFMCLNDDIDHHEVEEAFVVRKLLHDFYESFLPNPSSFERRSELGMQTKGPTTRRRKEMISKEDADEYVNSSKGRMNVNRPGRFSKESNPFVSRMSLMATVVISILLLASLLLLLILLKARMYGPFLLCIKGSSSFWKSNLKDDTRGENANSLKSNMYKERQRYWV